MIIDGWGGLKNVFEYYTSKGALIICYIFVLYFFDRLSFFTLWYAYQGVKKWLPENLAYVLNGRSLTTLTNNFLSSNTIFFPKLYKGISCISGTKKMGLKNVCATLSKKILKVLWGPKIIYESFL